MTNSEMMPEENLSRHEIMARDWANFPIVARRKAIMEYEEFLLTLEQQPMPPRHYFSKGIYAREIVVPRGTILTGAIHLTEHLCTVSKGDITIFSEFGVSRIRAPSTFVSPPGMKRLGFANEETVWTTYHVTDKKVPEEIMAEITVKTYEDFDKFMEDKE